MNKTATTEAAKGSFTTGVGMVPVVPLSQGRNNPKIPINSDANASNNQNQPRNPTHKHFDEAADRGSAIGASSGAAGMKATPTSRSGL
jgi:hypothetical protein